MKNEGIMIDCQTLKNSEEGTEFIVKKPLNKTQRIEPPKKNQETEIFSVVNNKENLVPVCQKSSYSKNYQRKLEILEKNSKNAKFMRKSLAKSPQKLLNLSQIL